MSNTSARSKNTKTKSRPAPIRREVGAMICGLLAVFCALGLLGSEGSLLAFLAVAPGYFIGFGVYCLPVFLLAAAFMLLFHRGRPVRLRIWSTMLAPLWIGGMAHVWFFELPEWSLDIFGELWRNGGARDGGGLIGGLIACVFHTLLGGAGAAIMFIAGLIAIAVMMFRIDVVGMVDYISNRQPPEYQPQPEPPKPARPVKSPPAAVPARERRAKDPIISELDKAYNEKRFDGDDEPVPAHEPVPPAPVQIPAPVRDARPAPADGLEPFGAVEVPPGFTPMEEYGVPAREPRPARKPRSVQSPAPAQTAQGSYRFPPYTLLNASTPGNTGDVSGETRAVTLRLAEVINSFKIDASAVNVVRGPSVTRYEFELAQGISLNKLTGRSRDIALNLGVDGVRIAPVSGKANIVGIEVPNRLVNTVYMRDVLDTREFTAAASKLTFALGKDIGGEGILPDISKLTHLLVAGTTGSGKSVCINSLIISLLYKATPDEVKLILIDPKMVELGVYNGIPHLLAPVVTDPKKASGALQWAVYEMEKRYRMLQERGVRNFFEYNAAVANEPGALKLSQVVIIIDELADLMMTSGKEVEESIIRIAQKARAAGMHLVLATQRPDANVITGLMKSNIPSRIAFAVSSGINSRIILDETGAEELIGRGDMLFAPLGAKISRVQGCLITEREVKAVVDFIKQNSDENYSDEVVGSIEGGGDGPSVKGGGEPQEDWDPILNDAMDVILEVGQASTSMLQRRLKLGYARAARVVDQLEERGLLGPSEGSKPRQILVSWEQWTEIKNKKM